MSVFEFPAEIQKEFLALKKDAADPLALRRHLQEGWESFSSPYCRDLENVQRSFRRHSLDGRAQQTLGKALWLKAEVLFHVDFRCQAYTMLVEAHRLLRKDPEVLASLIRIELTHGKLKDAALHLFEAKREGIELEDLDFFEEDLARCLDDDVETETLQRIQESEDRLLKEGEDPAVLVDLAAEYFYELLDLERGEEYIARAEAAGTTDSEAAFIGAEIAFEAGSYDLAMQRLRRLRLRNTDDARGPLLEMNVLCAQGLYQEALSVQRRVIGSPIKPLRVTFQDMFFQAPLGREEEYHQTWIRLYRRLQVAADGVGYFYSSGTPEAFFHGRLDAARIYHESQKLTLKYRHGDLVEEVEKGFRTLLAEAGDYTFLLDEFARFLLTAYPKGSARVGDARILAAKAVHLAELAGEPEDRFHATLEAAHQAAG